jgi:large subunit ribosomal protein L4
MEGKAIGEVELSEEIFAAPINEAAMHLMVRSYLAAQRQGTQSALTRGEVRGGGRKIYRQKGTGHARQGSTRAPQFTGGGTVFAPVPRDYSFKMNKKEKRAALKSALTSRVQENRLVVVDELKFDAPKTKDMVKVLGSLNADNALVVLNENDKNVVLSERNIDGVKMALTNTINVFDILNHKTLVLTKDAVKTIEEVYA